MSDHLQQLFEELPANLGNHLKITVTALLLGLALSLPTAILAVRIGWLRPLTLAVAGVIQTIPSLALFALMFPLLHGISVVTAAVFGLEFSALGFVPTVIALTLYSLLPILRNTVTGILEVDPAVTEAARGMGMTRGQTLWRVELPLALPVIVAGFRTATVWTVGVATLATPVGQECLGNYIFRGLHTKNWTTVLFGCVAAALLAVVLDALIGGLQTAAAERRRRAALWSAAILVLLVIAGLSAPLIAAGLRSAPVLVADGSQLTRRDGEHVENRTIRIGAKGFTEQYILSDLIATRLKAAGFDTRQVESLGSTVVFEALAAGEIDCYVDYTGTIWANYMKRGPASRWRVYAEMTGWLASEHGIRCLGPLGFENAYGLAMRRRHADELGIQTIADLARRAHELSMGGDYEIFGRPEWTALRESYALQFAQHRTLDPTLMYGALARGEVDVISAFTSDGRIAAFDLVVLDDPRNVIPPYDAVLLLSPQAAGHAGLAAALEPLIATISVEAMREANYLVDREEDKQTTSGAAQVLWEKIRRVHSTNRPAD